MNYVDVCVTYLVNCVLRLVVSPEDGSSLLPKRNVLCLVIFVTIEKVLVNAADITHVQPLFKTCMLQLRQEYYFLFYRKLTEPRQ